MRIGQITALLVVFFESRLMQDMSWPEIGDLTENPGGFSIIVSLVMLLVLSVESQHVNWTSSSKPSSINAKNEIVDSEFAIQFATALQGILELLYI